MDVYISYLVTMIAALLAGGLAYSTVKLAALQTRPGLSRVSTDRAFSGLCILYVVVFAPPWSTL